MIRAGKCQPHQRQDGMEEAFGLPQRQAKEDPEREGSLDGEIGVDWLNAALAGLKRRPGIDGGLTHPQGDVATMAQCLIILAPVLDTIYCFVFGMSMRSFMGLGHVLHRWR